MNMNFITKHFFKRYKSEGISIEPKELDKEIKKLEEEAKSYYKKLEEPITCSSDLYTRIWVWDELAHDLATRSVKTVKAGKPIPSSLENSVKFLQLFPKEQLLELKRKLYDASPNKREDVWNSFDLPMEELEEVFIARTKEQNLFAKNKGYENRVDMALDLYKIPKSNFKNFIDKADKVIAYCNQQLSEFSDLPNWFYSEFNNPCYLCRIASFPLKTQDEVLKLAMEKYKLLSKFEDKIDIELGGESKMSYKKESDSFLITIEEKINDRHKMMDLLHELAHVANYLELFEESINPYERGAHIGEREAMEIELSLLRENYPEIFKARLGDILLTYWEVLFMVEVYSDPEQVLGKLYASVFNRCFKDGDQKYNPTYMINDKIVYKFLPTLPHAVAQSDITKKLLRI